MKFQIGDIVEVYYEKGTPFAHWSGLVLRITQVISGSLGWDSIIGTVVKEVPGVSYSVNDSVTWGAPEALRHISVDNLQQITEEHQKYLSPFTGKWT